MSIIRYCVIPVEGVLRRSDVAELPNEADTRGRDKRDLLLLNIAAGSAVSLVSCAWGSARASSRAFSSEAVAGYSSALIAALASDAN